MAPKTLDLTTHAKTFADTYAHARRTGADRPLAQRFGLADVLGEIEEIIAKRVETAVAEAKSAATTTLQTERAKHAADLAAPDARTAELEARLAPVSVGRITADRITTGLPRYRAERVDGRRVIRDTATGRVADFGTVATLGETERWARELSSGSRSATGLVWDDSAYALRRRLASFRFSARRGF